MARRPSRFEARRRDSRRPARPQRSSRPDRRDQRDDVPRGYRPRPSYRRRTQSPGPNPSYRSQVKAYRKGAKDAKTQRAWEAKTVHPKSPRSPFAGNSGCYGCGSKDHVLRQCTKVTDPERRKKLWRRMQDEAKVNLAVADPVQEEEESDFHFDSDDASCDSHEEKVFR